MNTNNRYIKMTVFADRVRLAYIVYIGEIPGQAARARLDSDGDQMLSEAETAVFENEWSTRVRQSLRVESGDTELPVIWASTDVGLGDPRASAGAFSLDLVAWLCPPAGATSLTLTDTLVIPEPGESEVLFEESPEIEITRAELGPETGTRHTWNGTPHPIADGLILEWRASADTPPPPGACPEPPRDSNRRWFHIAAGLGALTAIAVIAVVVVRLWQRRG